MNSLQKRHIAKLVYREIRAVIDKWEYSSAGVPHLDISANWDGCITVDDELFHEHQLRDYEEV